MKDSPVKNLTPPKLPVSVVIPYHNEEKSLASTFRCLFEQTVRPSEVFFVNSCSTDKSSKMVDDFRLKYLSIWPDVLFKNLFDKSQTPSGAKNCGIKLANSEYLAFMDCGLLFPENWLESQWNFLKKNNLDIVSGLCVCFGAGPIDEAAIAQTYGQGRARGVVPSTMISKKAMQKIGLFKERRSGYDVEWQLKIKNLGMERGLNADVKFTYDGVNFANSLWGVFKKSFIYAAPTVGLRHYFIPYYYLAFLWPLLIVFFFLGPKNLWPALLLYGLLRGVVIPGKKAKNWFLFLKKKSSFFLFLGVGLVMDTGRLLGILYGVWRYLLFEKRPAT